METCFIALFHSLSDLLILCFLCVLKCCESAVMHWCCMDYTAFIALLWIVQSTPSQQERWTEHVALAWKSLQFRLCMKLSNPHEHKYTHTNKCLRSCSQCKKNFVQRVHTVCNQGCMYLVCKELQHTVVQCSTKNTSKRLSTNLAFFPLQKILGLTVVGHQTTNDRGTSWPVWTSNAALMIWDTRTWMYPQLLFKRTE